MSAPQQNAAVTSTKTDVAKVASQLKSEDYEKKSQIDTTHDYVRREQDERFGEIAIVQNKANQDILMMKEKVVNSEKEAGAEIIYARERLNLNHPHIQKLVDYSTRTKSDFCSKFYKVRSFYEYPDSDLKKQIAARKKSMTYFDSEELTHVAYQSLIGLKHLHSRGVAFGDLRPEFISWNKQGTKHKLLDRLRDPGDGVTVNRNNIMAQKPVYCSPAIYEIIKKRANIQHDEAKDDSWSLGLCLLEAATLDNVHDIYSTDGTINAQRLGQHLQAMDARYMAENQILCEMTHNLLSIPEANRFTPTVISEQLPNYDVVREHFDSIRGQQPAGGNQWGPQGGNGNQAGQQGGAWGQPAQQGAGWNQPPQGGQNWNQQPAGPGQNWAQQNQAWAAQNEPSQVWGQPGYIAPATTAQQNQPAQNWSQPTQTAPAPTAQPAQNWSQPQSWSNTSTQPVTVAAQPTNLAVSQPINSQPHHISFAPTSTVQQTPTYIAPQQTYSKPTVTHAAPQQTYYEAPQPTYIQTAPQQTYYEAPQPTYIHTAPQQTYYEAPQPTYIQTAPQQTYYEAPQPTYIQTAPQQTYTQISQPARVIATPATTYVPSTTVIPEVRRSATYTTQPVRVSSNTGVTTTIPSSGVRTISGTTTLSTNPTTTYTTPATTTLVSGARTTGTTYPTSTVSAPRTISGTTLTTGNTYTPTTTTGTTYTTGGGYSTGSTYTPTTGTSYTTGTTYAPTTTTGTSYTTGGATGGYTTTTTTSGGNTTTTTTAGNTISRPITTTGGSYTTQTGSATVTNGVPISYGGSSTTTNGATSFGTTNGTNTAGAIAGKLAESYSQRAPAGTTTNATVTTSSNSYSQAIPTTYTQTDYKTGVTTTQVSR